MARTSGRAARKAAMKEDEYKRQLAVEEENRAAEERAEAAARGERTEADANADLSQFARTARVVEGKKAREKKERARFTKTGLPALPKMSGPRKLKPERPCECGCGGMTRSRFVPGHNGRTKGWILRIERGVVKLEDIPAGEREVVERAMAAETNKAGTEG